jgi:hypothetical protein
MIRCVNPAPAVRVVTGTMFAPTRSAGPFVVTGPAVVVRPVPAAPALTSTGASGSRP